MRAHAPVVLLLLLLFPLIALPMAHASAPRQTIVLTVRAGAGGAYVFKRLPPGEYRVVSVTGSDPGYFGSLPAPMLLSFLPSPSLWQRLEGAPVSIVGGPGPSLRVVQAGDGSLLVGWVPARPGTVVRITLEKVAATGSVHGPGAMVIIVPDKPGLVAEAKRLAELHRRQGIAAKIVTTGYIYAHYAPARPPSTMCRDLPPGYNESLALRILAFAESLKGTDVRYILLIGGARDVPPIYYCSPTLKGYIGDEEAKVPSDYYYADPDGDGAPDFAVGRIPFSDPGKVAAYVDALEAWSKGGGWTRKALLAGGAPFGTDLFIGESALMSVIGSLAAAGLNTTESLLGMAGYPALQLAPLVGQYGLYYVVFHGTGSSLVDLLPGGLWQKNFVPRLMARDVPRTSHPGVWLTPACRAAFWDYDLVQPPFTPPSVATALLARGGAVAFIGYSRVAFEAMQRIEFGLGGLSLVFVGADAPLQMFARMLPGSPTLGDAWRLALTAYSQSPASKYLVLSRGGEEVLSELVLHEAEFLGDPAAPNPWGRGGAGAGSAPAMIPPGGSVEVDAAIMAPPIAQYVTGSVPALNPGASESVTITLAGRCPDVVVATALARAEGYLVTGAENLPVNTSGTSNSCNVTIAVPRDAPGTVRLLALWRGAAAQYYLLVGGAYLDNATGTVVLRGLDLLTTVGDEPLAVYVNGSEAVVVPGGATSWFLPLAALAPWLRGRVVVSVEPVQAHAGMLGGRLVLVAMEQLVQLYKVSAANNWARPAEVTVTKTVTETATVTKTVTTSTTATSTATETVTRTVTAAKGIQGPWLLAILTLVLVGDILAVLIIGRLPGTRAPRG